VGTPEALELRGDYPHCRGGTLELERVAGGPAVAGATQDSGAGGAQTWDGTWVGSNETWTVDLTVADGAYVLDAGCSAARAVPARASGSLDGTGQISAELPSVRWEQKAWVSGTPEELEFGSKNVSCVGTVLLKRIGGGPAVVQATQEAGEEPDVRSWDGTWRGEQGDWSLELTVEDRDFTLHAKCTGPPDINDTVTGRLDDDGQISVEVRTHYSAHISGSPDRLAVVPIQGRCGKPTVVELRREGDALVLAAAAEPAFTHFDGKWVGKATVVQGAYCAGTFAVEILVSDRNFTGRARPTTRPGWDSASYGGGQLLGIVDASGAFESKRITGSKNRYRGALHADSGKGSGEWFSDQCSGTFEVTRVEEPAGSASLP
jgi:hypothetical protein